MIVCKWPALLVLGDPVSEDLALEINLRTWSWCTNEHGYVRDIARRILGREPAPCSWGVDYPEEREARTRIGALPLGYLRSDWIASSWVGGPKGWCRPDGQIRTCNYNVGKWPSEEEIGEDLAAIAAAWPVLRMRVQILSGETGDPDLSVTDEWEVASGSARAVTPGPLLLQPEEAPWALARSEIGIEPVRVFAAIDQILGR